MALSIAEQKRAARLLCGSGYLSFKEYPEKFVVIANNGKKFVFNIDHIKKVLESSKTRKRRRKSTNVTDKAAEAKTKLHQTASKAKKTT